MIGWVFACGFLAGVVFWSICGIVLRAWNTAVAKREAGE